jgi:Ca-activated chloride channel family protein
VTTSAVPDATAPRPVVAGRLGDGTSTLPLTAVEIEAEIRGLVATTTVRQTYRNTHSAGIEATYIFPLPDRAGVTAFTADLAGRRVEGVLRERGAARHEYDEAVTAGHRAATAEEERPGVFTTRVGNLQPGEDAVITLTLTGPLAIDDGVAEFRFPLVVAPRYISGHPGDWLPVGAGTAPDTDAVPDASRITPPVLLPGLDSPVRLALRARLSGLGLTPDAIASSLHAVAATADGDGAVTVALHPGERLNRDVVLRFAVAAEVTAAITVVTPDEDDPTTGTWQVTVVPPAAGDDAVRGRDVVVVLDRSGSMGGWKMVAARRAAARVVDSLGVRDQFAVLAFDSVTEHPPGLTALTPATDRARWAAVEWLAGLEARGGTEMLDPVRTAATLLAGAGSPEAGEDANRDESGRDQFLILVTDGQVGAEDQILAAVAALTGRTRIFTLGIDQAVNAGFLRRLAAAGAGRCDLVESEARLDEVMTSLHRRISPPVATGLRVESATPGCELTAAETAPARDPDLFPGASCTLSGRWQAASPPAEVTLTVLGDGGFREQVTVAVAAPDRAVRTCWARARVRDLEDRYSAGVGDPVLADQITAVSLRHGVLSRFTAFVAVDRSRRADVSGPPRPAVQPVELPGGWTAAAGPMLGSSAPRPAPGPRPAGPGGRGRAAAKGVYAAAARRAPRPGPGGAHPAPPVSPSAPAAAGTPFSAQASRIEASRTESGPGGAADQALAAYAARAETLFRCVEDGLDREADGTALAARVSELADDLASVGSPGPLVQALRKLAEALRRSPSPQPQLAAARQAFADALVPPTPGRPRSREWWRTPGS